MTYWIGRGVGALLLILVAIWLAASTEWVDVTTDTPERGEAATNRWYALQKLAHNLGATVVNRPMIDSTLPPNATLILVTDNLPESQSNKTLKNWVINGGHLVVDSSMINLFTLKSWLPIRKVDNASKDKEKNTDNAPEKDNTKPADEQDRYCATWSQVVPVFDVQDFRACNVYEETRFELKPDVQARQVQMQINSSDGIKLLRVSLGRGRVTVLPFLGI
jgi:hypothetical protein